MIIVFANYDLCIMYEYEMNNFKLEMQSQFLLKGGTLGPLENEKTNIGLSFRAKFVPWT